MRRAFSSAVYLWDRATDTVLLVEHKRYGCWLPIGGELEPNETPQEAACRETKEETGIILGKKNFVVTSAGGPRGFLCYDEHEVGKKGLHLNFNFLVSAPTTEIVLSDEHRGFRWFPLKEIAFKPISKLDPPANVVDCLQRIYRGRF